jgi:hypothetical protein
MRHPTYKIKEDHTPDRVWHKPTLNLIEKEKKGKKKERGNLAMALEKAGL